MDLQPLEPILVIQSPKVVKDPARPGVTLGKEPINEKGNW